MDADPIPKAFIDPTLNKYYEELERLYPNHKNAFKTFVPVGSVGKKDFSGDIDSSRGCWLIVL